MTRKEVNEEFTSRIALAKLGPILVKYLQNLLAISTGSVIVLPSDASLLVRIWLWPRH